MSRIIRLYVGGVVIAAVAIGAVTLADQCGGGVELTSATAMLIALACITALVAELKPIITPGGNQITVVSSIFIASVLLLGAQWAIPIVVISIAGSHILSRRPLIRLLFNVAQYTLAVSISGLVLGHLLSASCESREIAWGSANDIFAVVVFLLLYFAINTGLVAVVVGLSEGEPILRTWHLSNVELLPQYSAMCVVGVMAAMLWTLTPTSMLLISFVVMIIYVSFALAESLKIAQQDLLLRMRQLERQTAELTLLNEVGAALTSDLDLESLWRLIDQRLRQLLDLRDVFIATPSAADDAEDSPRSFSVLFEHTAEPVDLAVRGQLIELWRRVLEERRPIARVAGRMEGDGAVEPATIGVPILVEDRSIGVLCCRSSGLVPFSDEDLRCLMGVADQIAVAIENTRLRRQAAEIEAIEQLNQLKTEFISAVSHELRSPLTPIVAYAELMMMRTFSPERTQAMAAEIHRGTIHLQRLVDDLLDISRIESGRLKIEPQSIRVEEIARSVAREYNTSALHTFDLQIDRDLPEVEADPTRIRQVLTNLIGNAVKYSPNGGMVVVKVSRVANEIVVAVTDQGVGIPPDRLDRVFEKFYRVDSEVTRRVRGTGLGLAISKHIVDAHRGRIWARSAGRGHGSTFCFSLPCESSASSPPLEPIMAAGNQP